MLRSAMARAASAGELDGASGTLTAWLALGDAHLAAAEDASQAYMSGLKQVLSDRGHPQLQHLVVFTVN